MRSHNLDRFRVVPRQVTMPGQNSDLTLGAKSMMTSSAKAWVALMVTALIVGLAACGSSGKSESEKAHEMVEGFMKAYAAGNADEMRSFLGKAAGSYDLSLITTDVLRKSIEKAPLSQITIPEPQETYPSTYETRVSFHVGAEATSLKLMILLKDKDQPTVMPRFASLSLENLKDIAVTVNGATPATQRPDILPGSYTFATANPYLSTVEKTITVTKTESVLMNGPILNEKGERAFRLTLQRAVLACLEERTLSSSCGLNVTGGPGGPAEGSVIRNMAPEDITRLGTSIKVGMVYQSSTVATTQEPLGTISYECERQPTACTGPQFREARIDMTKPKLEVEWR